MTEFLPRLQAVEAEIAEALMRSRRIIDFVNGQKPEPEVRVAIFNNVIVSIVSVVEEGIRSLLSEYLSILEEGVGSYQRLRKDLLSANLKGAAELLVQSLDEAKSIDAAIVARDLLKCLNDESGFKLFKAQITYNRYNLRSGEITQVGKRAGVRKIWEGIRSNPAMQVLHPDLDETQVEQAMLERWNALFDERDTIVHRISQAAGWGDTIILPYIIFVQAVMGCFVTLLAADVGELLLPMAPKGKPLLPDLA
jgi:hypothetical protein